MSHFCLGWLSSDDDEWLTSSLQSEFMKDFDVEEVCMNENVVSSYKIKNIILTKYFQYFSAATRWPHRLNTSSSSHMKQKPKTDIGTVLQRLENNKVSTL